MVYGRRKVGKTFTPRNCTKYNLYITVTRSGEALLGDDLRRLDEAQREAVKTLKRGPRRGRRIPESAGEVPGCASPPPRLP